MLLEKSSFIQVCFCKLFKLVKFKVAFYDIVFFEDKCRFCNGFDSFTLILDLPKVGIFPCCRNQYSRDQASHLGNWRTQVYYDSGPEELTLKALSSKQRDYRVFIDKL